jgi:O-antigen ligase
MIVIESHPRSGRRRGAPQQDGRVRALDIVIRWGLFVLLAFDPLAFGAMEPWSQLVLKLGAATLFVLWAAMCAIEVELDIEVNPLYWPMAGFDLVVIAQILFGLSQYVQLTRDQFSLYIAYAMLAVVASQVLRGERKLQAFLLALSVFGGCLALFAILQDLTANGALYWIRVPREGGTIFGPYVNRNHYAGLMEMLAVIPAVLALGRRFSGPQRGLLALASVLMGASIFMSGSRAGSVAFVCQILFLGFAAGKAGRRNNAAWLAPLMLAAVAGFLFWIDGSHMLDRFTSVHMKVELAGGRWAINKDALRMWKSHPITGFGLGNFAESYPQYRSFYTDFFVNELHDDYAQLLVETGIFGFLAGISFVIITWIRGISAIKAPNSGANLRLATLAGCVGIFIHSFADFNLHIPANAALFYVLALVTASTPSDSYSREVPLQWK